MSAEDTFKQARRKKLLNQILNHQVQGEAFILTDAITWKGIVLKHFKKIQSGQMTVEELVVQLETKYGVKYTQKHSLVKYPIEEFLKYIAKVTKQPL